MARFLSETSRSVPLKQRNNIAFSAGYYGHENFAHLNWADAALADVGKVNHIVLSYREDLYSRLPQNYDVLIAGLQDAGERAACGLNANGFFATVSGGIRAWALSQAKPGQVQNMLDQVIRIKDAVAKDANKPYHKLVDENGVKWKVEGAMIDTRKLDELIKFLQANVAASSGGGLKFKDDK